MVIAIAWIAAGGIALVTFAVLGYGLLGHVRRFGRAVDDFQAEVEPRLRELQAIAQRRSSDSA